jgi:hypothetical protein
LDTAGSFEALPGSGDADVRGKAGGISEAPSDEPSEPPHPCRRSSIEATASELAHLRQLTAAVTEFTTEMRLV